MTSKDKINCFNALVEYAFVLIEKNKLKDYKYLSMKIHFFLNKCIVWFIFVNCNLDCK